jgi:predicted AAA+ superfamily ATPase
MVLPLPLFPRRRMADRVETALGDTPVVMIEGPRQCGKTTLALGFAGSARSYVTLDDENTLASAKADPAGFLRTLDSVVIDEIQRAPDLLRAVKHSVDADRRPGRFLLTGSASLLSLPKVADSLAGRMEIVTLLPLSQSEIFDTPGDFLERAMAGQIISPKRAITGDELVRAVLTGGFPEMLRRSDHRRRSSWARDYVRAIVERDVRDISEVFRLEQIPKLVRLLAHHAGQLTNFAELGGQIGLDDKTTRKYAGILEQLFLVRRVEPWFRNSLKRLIKTPKLHFIDPGLLAMLSGATPERLARDRGAFGPLLETFVMAEMMKLAGWSNGGTTISHYRDKDQTEVDFIVESADGAILGVEVKASATVTGADFKGLRKVADATGPLFKLGVVLYDGERILPFGDRLFAAPVSCLWGGEEAGKDK